MNLLKNDLTRLANAKNRFVYASNKRLMAGKSSAGVVNVISILKIKYATVSTKYATVSIQVCHGYILRAA
jgi:hypothetical protein